MAKFGMGQALRRREDSRFLTGLGQYIDDLSIDGALHLHVLRSTHAHAEISSIDTAAALAMPGVATILTAADLGPDEIGPLPCLGEFESVDGRTTFMPPYPILATGRVRHVGQAVAAVIAEAVGVDPSAGL